MGQERGRLAGVAVAMHRRIVGGTHLGVQSREFRGGGVPEGGHGVGDGRVGDSAGNQMSGNQPGSVGGTEEVHHRVGDEQIGLRLGQIGGIGDDDFGGGTGFATQSAGGGSQVTLTIRIRIDAEVVFGKDAGVTAPESPFQSAVECGAPAGADVDYPG